MRYLLFLLLSTVLLRASPIAPPEFDTPQLRLFYFSCDDNLDGIDAALSEGALIDHRSIRGYNALHYTILLNREKAFAHLLSRGADISMPLSSRSHNRIDPLGLCVVYDRMGMAQTLLKKGADCMKTQDLHGVNMSAFAYAALYNRFDLFKQMVEMGADINQQIEQNGRYNNLMWKTSILAIAAKHGDLQVVEYLVEELGASVNYSGVATYTPLWFAIKSGNKEVAQYLIEHGANVNAIFQVSKNGKKRSCLWAAAKYGWTDITQLLLANGAKVRTDASHEELPYVISDIAGYQHVYDIYETMGYDSELWEHLEAEVRAEGRVVKPSVFAPATGLGAKLLEGEWSKRSPLSNNQSSDRNVKLAIIADLDSRDIEGLLSVEFGMYQHIDLLERSAIDHILSEHGLDRAGLTKGHGMSRAATLLGADALVFIEQVSIDSENYHELKLVNAVRGLQLNTSYCATTGAAMLDQIESYARDAADSVKLLYRDLSSVAPVTLVNVRSDHGSASGLQFESIFKRIMEMRLAASPNVLLMQRSDLDQLLREKTFANLVNEDFAASAIFLDVRLDLNQDQTAIQSVTLRMEDARGEQNILTMQGDRMEIETLVHQATSAFLEEVSTDGVGTFEVKSLDEDANKLYHEALWQASVGLDQQGLNSVKNSIALGFDQLKAWDLYLSLVEKLSVTLHADQGDHAVNLRRLELERERLMALDGFWRRFQSDIERGKFRPVSGSHYSTFNGFVRTLDHFRPVSLKRKYERELHELELQYLNFLECRILPIFDHPETYLIERFEPNYFYARNVQRDAILPLSRFMTSPEQLGQIIQQLASGYTQVAEYPQYTKFDLSFSALCASPSGPGWDEQFLTWLDESGDVALSNAYAYSMTQSNRGSFYLYRNLSIQAKESLHSRIHRNILQLNELQYLTLRQNMAVLNRREIYYDGVRPSLDTVFFSLNNETTYRTYECEESALNLCRLTGGTGARLQAKKFNHLDLLQQACDLFKTNMIASSDTHKRELRAFEGRIAAMEPKQQSQAQTDDMHEGLDTKVWHPSLYGFPQYNHHNSFLHAPVIADGYWWLVGTIRYDQEGKSLNQSKEDREYYLFKVNPATLETTARTFRASGLNARSYYSASISNGWMMLLRLTDRTQQNSFNILNINSLEMTFEDDYKPLKDGYSVDGKFYCLVTPWETYDGRGWSAANPIEMLLFVEYDFSSGEWTTLFNSRRNPPETILDYPPRRPYHLWYKPSEHHFVIGDKWQFAFDLETQDFQKMDSTKNSHPRLKHVQSTGFSQYYQVEGGYWGTTKPSSAQLVGLPPKSLAFNHVHFTDIPGGNMGRQGQRALNWKIDEAAQDFEPYERYIAAIVEGKQTLKNQNISMGFGEHYGYIRVFPRDSSRGKGIPFYVFFNIDAFRSAFNFAKQL